MCRVRLTPVTAQLLHEAFPLLAADATYRNDAAHHREDIFAKAMDQISPLAPYLHSQHDDQLGKVWDASEGDVRRCYARSH